MKLDINYKKKSVKAMKRIKYLGINLPKETKELYTENYDINEKKKHKQMKRYSIFLHRKNQYC